MYNLILFSYDTLRNLWEMNIFYQDDKWYVLLKALNQSQWELSAKCCEKRDMEKISIVWISDFKFKIESARESDLINGLSDLGR